MYATTFFRRLHMSIKKYSCKNIINYIRQNPWTCISALILIIQFLLIFICNMKLIDNNIDCDSAKILLHAQKMWEHGTYLIPDWTYMTTLELDCPTFLAVPLYGLTHNIYVAYGLANTLILAGFISLVFFLFRDKPVLYPLLACNLLCVPYSIGMLDYFNMMFFSGAFYVIRVAMPVFLIALILWIENNTAGKKPLYKYIPLILFEAFILLCAFSSGIYVLCVGIFPILVTYVLYKVFMCERVPILSYIVLGLCLIFSFIGVLLNGICMGDARGTGMILISVYQILANVYSCLAGIFELFGGIAQDMDVAVMSLAGIGILLKAILVHILFVCGIIAIGRIAKEKIDLRILLLMSVFIWNLFVLLATNTRAGSATYEYRYHLIGMIPLMFVAVQILLDGWRTLKPFQKNFFAAAGVCFIIALNVFSFPKALDPTDEQADLKALCSYCDALDFDYVYLYDASDDADMCRLITESDAEYLCVTPAGVTWAYIYYEKYVNAPFYPENAIFVVNNETHNMGDSFEAFGYKFEKFDTIAGRTLYYFSK